MAGPEYFRKIDTHWLTILALPKEPTDERRKELTSAEHFDTHFSVRDLFNYAKSLEGEWHLNGLLATVLSSYSWARFETSRQYEYTTVGIVDGPVRDSLIISAGQGENLLKVVYAPEIKQTKEEMQTDYPEGFLQIWRGYEEKVVEDWDPIEVREVCSVPGNRLELIFGDYKLELIFGDYKIGVSFQHRLIIDEKGNFHVDKIGLFPRSKRKMRARFVDRGFLRQYGRRKRLAIERQVLRNFLRGMFKWTNKEVNDLREFTHSRDNFG